MAFIAVVRTDLVGPVFLNDLETVSQRNFPNEPPGQDRYISQVNLADVQAWMDANAIVLVTATAIVTATVPAGGPVDISTATIDAIHASIAALGGDGPAGPLHQGILNNLRAALAYSFVETSRFLLSFDRGVIASYADATFEYEGVVGALIDVVDDDGTTPFVLP